MGGIVHADHADAEFVGEFPASVHGLVGDGLAEFEAAVPNLGGGEAGGEPLDLRSRFPASDLAAEQLVQMEGLDGVVRADAVIGGAGAKARPRRRFVRRVAAGEIGLPDQLVMFFARNDVIGVGHGKVVSK